MFFLNETQELKFNLEVLGEASFPVLVLLEGSLGVGKTTFVKEFFSLYSYSQAQVQSPTFLKLLEHRINNLGFCVHMDCYRIDNDDDYAKLSLEGYMDAKVWFVEWPDSFIKYLAKNETLTHILGFKKAYLIEFSGVGALEMKPIECSSLFK